MVKGLERNGFQGKRVRNKQKPDFRFDIPKSTFLHHESKELIIIKSNDELI